MSTRSLCALTILHRRGIGELAPNLVLRKGGTRGVIGFRGDFRGTRRENLLRRKGQSILFLNSLKMNLRSEVSTFLEGFHSEVI